VIHQFISKVLLSSEAVREVKSEQSLRIPRISDNPKENFLITGRFDNFIELVEGENVLIEVKTTRNLDYQKSASLHHIMQLTPYLLYKQGLKGAILYIDMNFQTKVFEVIYDPKLMLEIMKRAENLHMYLVEDKMPLPEAKDIPEKNWECKYICNYKEECDKCVT